MTFLFVLLGLACLYLWLRGWWFACVIVCLGITFFGWNAFALSWLVGVGVGFAPMLVWRALEAERLDRLRKRHAAGVSQQQIPLSLTARNGKWS